MSTNITKLPNELSENNNIVMKINNKTKSNDEDVIKQLPNQSQQHTPQLSQESIHQIVKGLQNANGATFLPPRDIHTNTSHIVQDDTIKANFIPTTKNKNYIENEADMESLIKQNKNKNKEQDRLDILYNELQTPLLLMILFFFFQLPYFNEILIKYIPSVFSRDGNLMFSGYFIKTLFFGISFYAITQLTNQLSEI